LNLVAITERIELNELWRNNNDDEREIRESNRGDGVEYSADERNEATRSEIIFMAKLGRPVALSQALSRRRRAPLRPGQALPPG